MNIFLVIIHFFATLFVHSSSHGFVSPIPTVNIVQTATPSANASEEATESAKFEKGLHIKARGKAEIKYWNN